MAGLLDQSGVAPRPPGRSPAVSKTSVWRVAQNDARALGHRIDPRRLLGGLLGLADAILIAGAAGVAHVLRHGRVPATLGVVTTVILAVVLALNALYFSGAYTTHLADRVAQQVARAARAWTAVVFALVLLGYLTKTSEIFSRAWAGTWYLVALGLLIGGRVAAAAQIARWRAGGRLGGTVAIVDLAGCGETVARRLRRSFPDDVSLAGVFRPGNATEPDSVADLLALSRLFRIDEVLVFVSPVGTADAAETVRRLGAMPANVRLCPVMPDFKAVPLREGGLVMGQLALTVHRKPLVGWGAVVKRAEDLVIGGIGLLLLAPFMLGIAACIRVDSAGPILFRQGRQGFNNNVFTVYKFRTMVHRPAPETDVPQARRNDPRVTRIGRILRRTSLDELPQLLNVLQGDMALVRPRPHAIAHNELYAGLIDGCLARHRVQPGITGWAQVNGLRGETDTLEKMQRRVQYDLDYIERWSVLLDFRIMATTVLTALFDRQAY